MTTEYYRNQPQRFEYLNVASKEHCQLLLDYAKDNLTQRVYDEIATDFDILFPSDQMNFPEKLRREAKKYLDNALAFINKDTLYTYLKAEEDHKDEEEMHNTYGVATAEDIYHEA